MWMLIAFALSLMIPANGIFLSLFHGIFGRLYIVYFIIKYHEILFSFIKKFSIYLN